MAADEWSTSQLLSLAARTVQRQYAECLAALGLSRLGLYVLEYLAESSPILQSDLARLVFARPQTVGRVLVRLEEHQWVTRRKGEFRNQIAVSITDHGRSILAAAQEALKAVRLPTQLDALRPALCTIISRTAH